VKGLMAKSISKITTARNKSEKKSNEDITHHNTANETNKSRALS